VPRATLAALLILVLSAGISFGYVVQRGGLDMPAVADAGTPSPEALVTPPTEPPAELQSGGAPGASASTPDPAPTVRVTPSPTALPTAEPTAKPAPTAEPTAEPTARPTPTAERTPNPTTKPKPSATPRSDRYKLLVKCPDRNGCWIYRIRSGDNLFSIANYFGHSLKTIYTWNPQYPGTRLKVGAEIRMPPPTR
jgi:outer membrane biosynthesis protein TonB